MQALGPLQQYGILTWLAHPLHAHGQALGRQRTWQMYAWPPQQRPYAIKSRRSSRTQALGRLARSAGCHDHIVFSELAAPAQLNLGAPCLHIDRKSAVSGKSVSVSVDLGGRRIFKKK